MDSLYSRYDLMTEADSAFDAEDGERYPDPLSVNYAKAKFTEIPHSVKVTQGDIHKMWLHMYNNYDGLKDHDDLLLNLNGFPYVGLMTPGDTLYEISKTDLENFNQG
jgi:hypothetical protein